jgi:hypothetical protein
MIRGRAPLDPSLALARLPAAVADRTVTHRSHRTPYDRHFRNFVTNPENRRGGKIPNDRYRRQGSTSEGTAGTRGCRFESFWARFCHLPTSRVGSELIGESFSTCAATALFSWDFGPRVPGASKQQGRYDPQHGEDRIQTKNRRDTRVERRMG